MPEQLNQLRQQAAGGTFCIVPYNHPDFAWCHSREWHEERYAVSTAEALDLMRAHPEFRFCLEPWIDQIIPFLERCPDRIEELRERLNSGQMGVKAFTLTSPRPATCGDETFLRNMTIGRRWYRAFAPDCDLSVMACPDVGIGHSQMPQVCKLAGATMYRGWRSDSVLSYKGVPRNFVWRGLDGTEIITSRGCYGGMLGHLPEPLADNWEQALAQLYATDLASALEQAENKTWWVAQGMDDARPLRTFEGDRLLPWFELVQLWNQRENSRMMFATPNEFAALLAEEQLPVWEGVLDEVDVAYNSGWHGQPGLWRLRQDLEREMLIAERAWALAELIAPHPRPLSTEWRGENDCRAGTCAPPAVPAPHRQPDGDRGLVAALTGEDRLTALWVETIRLASHALQWVFEKDWTWLTSRGRYLLREIQEETARAVTMLSGVGRQWQDQRPIVLFNPLPYPREEIVEVPWVQPRQESVQSQVLDAEGNPLPTQLGEPVAPWVGRMVWEAPLIFKARVPALGCAVYRVGEGERWSEPAPPEADTVSNGRLRLRLSGRGLQEAEDLESGLLWRAPASGAIGDCKLHEMAEGVLHVGPVTAEIGGMAGQGQWVCTGPLRWVYRWETEFHGQRVRQDVILDDGARYVDLVTRVYCSGANGFFGLVFDLPFHGALAVDVPFGVEKRNPDAEVYADSLPFSYQNIERHRRHQFWARSFASFSNERFGLSIITADGDKYWTYEGATRRLRHILFTPLDDDDQDWERWVTKSRLALGWHQFRHRVVFHEGNWRAADICGESDRLRLPLVAVKPLGFGHGGGVSGVDQLAVAPDGVRLSAFYRDQAGYVLRLYESVGEAAEVTVKLPCAFATATKTDLNLEPMDGEVRLEGHDLRLNLRPWEIATLLLTR